MIKCYIVDDEAHAIAVLSRYIERTPGLELAGAEENPLNALHTITVGKISPDIIFMDVDMPQLSGMDLAELLRPYAEVVFTTAFPSYALQAFEQNTFDYMLKPISYERFLKSINKMRPLLRASGEGEDEQKYFFIKSETKGKMVKVDLEEITYIEGLQNYIRIHVDDGAHVAYLTLKEIEGNLPVRGFSRVHKSFIVNMARVRTIEGNQIILDDKSIISLGASYRDAFLGGIYKKLIESKRGKS